MPNQPPTSDVPGQAAVRPDTVGTPEERNEQEIHRLEQYKQLELRLYSHSNLFYWWLVWSVGFLMALLTWVQGKHVDALGVWEWYHPSSNPGIIFFMTLFLVLLVTNVSLRGTASVVAVLAVVLVTVLLAWFGWWDAILHWVGRLHVHLNLGAYLAFSTLLFVVWAATVFGLDRTSYWLIKPGQITQDFIFGADSRSYNTTNMVLEKFQGDLFRNWIIGLGSGDLHIQTTGTNRERIDVPNVLFITRKVALIQEMIAIKPDAFGSVTVK